MKHKFTIVYETDGLPICPDAIHKKLDLAFTNIRKKFDKQYIWRNYYNNKLKNEYLKLFNKFDSLIYFKSSSFSNVLKWRLKQENKLRKKYKKTRFMMNTKNISEFIKHYEKLTKWMMKVLPTKADLTVFVDKNQKIKKISNV